MKARESVPLRNLVFVGRLTEQKDPLAFIRIMRDIQTPGRAVTGTMLGLGEPLEECRQGIARLQLESLLEMPGYCANPYPTIASSKVCIIPSRWEGFGLVALEAMSLCVAVLGRRMGGLADILGKVSPELICDSEEQFVTKVRELLANEPKRRELAEKGKRFVEKEFALGEFVGQIEAVYRDALGKKHSLRNPRNSESIESCRMENSGGRGFGASPRPSEMALRYDGKRGEVLLYLGLADGILLSQPHGRMP